MVSSLLGIWGKGVGEGWRLDDWGFVDGNLGMSTTRTRREVSAKPRCDFIFQPTCGTWFLPAAKVCILSRKSLFRVSAKQSKRDKTRGAATPSSDPSATPVRLVVFFWRSGEDKLCLVRAFVSFSFLTVLSIHPTSPSRFASKPPPSTIRLSLAIFPRPDLP